MSVCLALCHFFSFSFCSVRSLGFLLCALGCLLGDYWAFLGASEDDNDNDDGDEDEDEDDDDSDGGGAKYTVIAYDFHYADDDADDYDVL